LNEICVFLAALKEKCVWDGVEPAVSNRSLTLWRLSLTSFIFNPLTPNDPYSGRTAQLTSKRCILYIYSTNTGTEYFKHVIYCPFFSLKCSLFHNFNVFSSCFNRILYTGVLKLKKNNSGAKRLKIQFLWCSERTPFQQ